MSGLSELEAVEAGAALPHNGMQKALNGSLEWVAIALLGTLTILVFANAVGRYLFTYPLPWTEELAINIMVWLAGVGIVLAGMRQSLICCNILSYRISRFRARMVASACALLGAVVMAYLSWLTWRYMLIFGGDLSPILKIPKLVAMAGLFFATTGLTATLLTSIFKR